MANAPTFDEFTGWIRAAETEAAENGSGYKRKVGLFAMLGYAFVFGLIILTLAALVGLVALVALRESGGATAGIAKLGFVLAIFGFMVASALWVKIDPPTGKRITRDDFPDLFADIDDLQRKLDALPIHEVILVPDLNAFVAQTPRLGVLGWQRNTLGIGLELMLVLDREEMRSVLAHELGHLSGNHSKFAGWIYRVRKTWTNLNTKFSELGGWGGWLIRKFFFWYVPRFDAYSFALRRLNEYEADAAAAELTSADDAARALVKINIFAGYLDRVYWDGFFSQASETPQPSRMAYAGFADRLETLDLPIDTLEAFRKHAMARETGYQDTHPALRDRLAGLGRASFTLDYDKLDFKRSVAHDWLGPKFDEVIGTFDADWWQTAQERWEGQYQKVAAERRELTELQARPIDDLTLDELWTLGVRTSRHIGGAEALPIFQTYKARDDQDFDVAMVLGRLLAQQGDDACLAEWGRIPREHKEFVRAHDEAAVYLDNSDRSDEAKEWRAKADKRYAEVQAIEADHSGVSTDDTLIEPQLSQANLDYLRERLLAILAASSPRGWRKNRQASRAVCRSV